MSSPFNEEKYKRLLEGLEISEVLFSELKIENKKFRIDDEYFNKKYVNAERKIQSKKYVRFSTIIDTLTDFHSNGSYEAIANEFELLDNPNYAYMVRTTDLETANFNDDVKYVTRKCYDFLSKSKVYGGELLINKIGSPGRSYLMPQLNRPVSLGMNLFLIRVKKDSGFNESFLYVFFNTEIGKNIIYRKINGTVPLTIDKESIKSLSIPSLSYDFQQQIEQIIKLSQTKLEESKKIYNIAKEQLLIELGLNDWQPKNENINEKKISESLSCTGRLDAEYYQPKYDELLSKLSYYDCDTIKGIASIKKSVEPGSEAYQDSGIPFIRVSDVTKYGISEPNIFLTPDDFNLNELQPRKDTILLSKDGSVGIAYKVEEDMDCITSSALLHLSIFNKDYTPDYLTLVLNSIVVQMQAERDSNGAIIQHWKPSEIEQVIIPKLPKPIQENISAKIQESFALKAESERLLDEAKMMVEWVIEKG